MYKAKYDFPDRILTLFEPSVESEHPSWLNAQLLADLHNLAWSLGTDCNNGFRRINGQKISVSVSVKPKISNYLIITSIVDVENDQLNTFFTENGKFIVCYDKRLTFSEIVDDIELVDSVMIRQGRVCPDTFARHYTPQTPNKKQSLYEVEKVFNKAGGVMPVSGDRSAANSLVNQFDEPEKLTILERYGTFLVCKREEIEAIERREKVFAEILKERAISCENLSALSEKELFVIKREIFNRAGEADEPSSLLSIKLTQ